MLPQCFCYNDTTFVRLKRPGKLEGSLLHQANMGF